MSDAERKAAVDKILAILQPLAPGDREDVMGMVTAIYCRECWSEHPTPAFCQCWNDE